METKTNTIQIEERYVDCWRCNGDGDVWKDVPVHTFGRYGIDPWEYVIVTCWVCNGVGHLGEKL